MQSEALKKLIDGNHRFVNNLKMNRNLLQQVNQTRDGQQPFAAIVSCMDSRTSAELIFDQGLGDIFSIRLAGNVISENVLGSLEYACKVAGSKLIVILGHTKCGAIIGACDHVQMGNLSFLLNKIEAAINFEKTETDRSSKNKDFVDKVTNLHIYKSVQQVTEQSVILRDMIDAGEIGIIGGIYDVETGEVSFFEDTWMSGSVKKVFSNYIGALQA
jgi:carbonic anhydrase